MNWNHKKTLKFFLILFNTLVCLYGASLLILAVWLKFTTLDERFHIYFQSNISKFYIDFFELSLLFIGVFILIVGTTGCYGVIQYNSCLLTFFMIFIIMLIIMQAASLCSLLVLVNKSFYGPLRVKLVHELKRSRNVTKFMHYFQQNAHCCGVTGAKDYTNSTWSSLNYKKLVPHSCCNASNAFTHEFVDTVKDCTDGNLDFIFKRGCFSFIEEYHAFLVYLVYYVVVSIVLSKMLDLFLFLYTLLTLFLNIQVYEKSSDHLFNTDNEFFEFDDMHQFTEENSAKANEEVHPSAHNPPNPDSYDKGEEESEDRNAEASEGNSEQEVPFEEEEAFVDDDSGVDHDFEIFDQDDEEFEVNAETVSKPRRHHHFSAKEGEDPSPSFGAKKMGSAAGGRAHMSSNAKPEIVNVPLHLYASWKAYYIEIILAAILSIYIINFFFGKMRNNKYATMWLNANREILEANCALVGDDGVSQEINESHCILMKESESFYGLWCSGRVGTHGLKVDLRLIKRQDLLSLVLAAFRKQQDQFNVTVTLSNAEDIAPFIFVMGSKKTVNLMSKEMADLSLYSLEKKTGASYNIPSKYSILNEISEATQLFFDNKICAFLSKYPNVIDYIHISDQFSGVKPNADSSSAESTGSATGSSSKALSAKTKPTILISFNISKDKWAAGDQCESLRQSLQLVFYIIDKVRRLKLSKEARHKAERNRSRVEESLSKLSHSQRSDAAALRREERIKAEKDRALLEEDPFMQKKYEDKEMKREMKKRNPKNKQIKVKMMF